VDRTNSNTALASALAEELARSGVEHACVAPGSRSAPLALALWHEPAIRVWSHVDERCAAFFALGIAQQTGRPAVVLTTSGTAVANAHPAVAEASEARVPLIVISADRPPRLRGRGAGQTIDQLKLFGSAVRWFCELGVTAADEDGLLHVRSAATRAVAATLEPPPGPVHLNIPLEEPLAPTPDDSVTVAAGLAADGRHSGAPITSVRRGLRSPTPSILAATAQAIAEEPCGAVVAGRQRDPELAGAVAALARAADYPILREPPQSLRPRLVLRLGDMVTSKALRRWLGGDHDAHQIVIDPDGAWNEPTATADEILRVDPRALCDELSSILPRRPDDEWLERWLGAARAADQAIDDFMESLGDELFEPRVHRALTSLLPPGSTVYVASSMPVRDLETFFGLTATPVRFLANRGANGIDGLVSSGLGAAAAAAGRMFVLIGDVGLYHDMNGLLAVKRLGVEATIVVFANGGGAIFDFLPIADFPDGYEELFATPTGLELEKVADLYGLPFTRLEDHGGLGDALARPGLVEVPLDRTRNVELHRRVFALVAEAVSASPLKHR
jgi:2-succinyl-5-enolpyruvyl-6-hydroxy-3-cyclohexene-1-carboxylate synthase